MQPLFLPGEVLLFGQNRFYDMDIQLTTIEKMFNIGQENEVRALHNISLHIKSGEVVCLQGPSGSGKTTLLSILGCVYGCTSGSTVIGGKKLFRLPDRFLTKYRRKVIGFVHQHYNLLNDRTVLENICLPLLPLGISPKEQRGKAEKLLKKLHIGHREKFLISQISGGEQQRVAIARALINEPPILLADEPTAHLDQTLSHEFMDIVERLKGEGKTIVLSSHDPYVTGHSLVDRVLSLKNGTLLETV